MQLKYCPNCQQRKSLDNFHKNRARKDGYTSICKECKKTYQHEYFQRPHIKAKRAETRQLPEWKAKRKEEGRKYRLEHREELKQKIKKYKERYKGRYRESTAESVKRWLARDPNRGKAHRAVNDAVRKGDIPHISNQSCIQCGQRALDYHHHKGYSPEHWLNVIPVCRNCHKAMHNQ